MSKLAKIGIGAVASVAISCWSVAARGQGWPDVFDPLQVLSLNLEIDSGAWQIIKADETFDIEVPAMFFADGEDPILISVRRKSGTPVGDKVSLKLDINEYVSGQLWRGLNKLSLENGDDTDIVSEGLAWHMHRRAAATQPEDGLYLPGLAAWVTLKVHLVVDGEIVDSLNAGVYVNVEQVDERFLRNRGLWRGRDSAGATRTWLYKQSDIGPAEVEEGDPPSPAVVTLDYSPFVAGGGKGKKSGVAPTPDDETLATQLPMWIDLDGMLTLGAVNAFTDNPDELFNKGKNFFWMDSIVDFRTEGRRLYFPWDLDSVIRKTDSSIYGIARNKGNKTTLDQHPYQETILNHPLFRARYNAIMGDLLSGPLGEDQLEFLDQLEPILTPLLQADGDSKVGDHAAEHFFQLRAWILTRNFDVKQQLEDDLAP